MVIMSNRYLSFDGCRPMRTLILRVFCSATSFTFRFRIKELLKDRQAMYLVELDGPKTRSVVVQIMGE